MNLSEIKRLVNEASTKDLKASEEALYDEQSLPIKVNGVDEGEKLTHILAAIWIKDEMDKTGDPLPKVLRNYTAKVRKSIS